MTNHESWVLRARPAGRPDMRLFCFPSAGYGAAMYRSWGGALPPSVEVCALTLPGRETLLGKAPIADFVSLTEQVTAQIEPLLDRPFAFFGHSMGAWLAFEVARSLQRAGGRSPVHLFVSGRRAPHLPSRESPVHDLDDEALIAEIQRRYNGIPTIVLKERELLAMLLPALRADLTALETYRYQESPPLACPLSCYGGAEDALVTFADLDAWRQLTAGSFEVKQLPGGHYYLQENAKPALLGAISARL